MHFIPNLQICLKTFFRSLKNVLGEKRKLIKNVKHGIVIYNVR